MAHVAEYKKRIVEDFANLMEKYSITAIVNMENMPTPQLQKMRELIRNNIVLKMSKKRFIALAFDKAKEKKKGIDGLNNYLSGMPALMFTDENPFKLYKTLSKNKSEAPAKPGQIAPKNLVVPAGPTSFAPGPIIGELGAAGIKAGIDAGKVVIKQDSLVVKKGDKITQKQAEMLTRLGIKPMEIGLDLVAAYENGTIFEKDILAVNEIEYINKLAQAGTWAINLAVEAGYTTKDTIELMISKAFMDAKALGLSENIMADKIAEDLLAKAEREMLSLKGIANIEVPEKKSKTREKSVEEQLDKEEKLVEPKSKKEKEPKQEKKPAQEQQEKKKAEEQPKFEGPVKEKAQEQKTEEKQEQAKPEPQEKPKATKEEKKVKESKIEDKLLEQKSEEPTDKKINEIVKKIKDHVTGKDKELDAEKLVEDVKSTTSKEKPVKKTKEEKIAVKEVPKSEKSVLEKSKDVTYNQVDEIVKKIKDHATGKDKELGKKLSAEKLVEDIKKQEPKPKKEDKVPTLQELTERKKKSQVHK